MRRMVAVLFLLFCVLGVGMIVDESVTSAQQSQIQVADTAGALAVVQSYVTAFNAHDGAALAAIFAEDGSFINPFGVEWRGRAAMEAGHTMAHTSLLRQASMRVDSSHVRFLRPDVAIVTSQWTISGAPSPSGKPMPGVTTSVMTSANGAWTIQSWQVTFVSPMPASWLQPSGQK